MIVRVVETLVLGGRLEGWSHCMSELTQRQVLHLGEINDSQREAWRKSIEVQDEGLRRQVSLFPAQSLPADSVNAIGVLLNELRLERPRQ